MIVPPNFVSEKIRSLKAKFKTDRSCGISGPKILFEMENILKSSNKKALTALAIGGFGIGMTEFVIMGILPDVANALSISIPETGHFIAAYALGVVVGALLLTGIGGKWPAHKVLLFLMLWFTVFNTLSAFAGSYEALWTARFLSGLPHGAFFGIGAVVAGKLAKKGKGAKAIATMMAGLPIAMGYGFTSADLVGAALAASGVVIGGVLILSGKRILVKKRKWAYEV